MPNAAKQLSENASFQAFINCYLREVDSGVWHTLIDWQRQSGLMFDSQAPYVLELQLTGLNITLVCAASYRSVVGRHVFTHVFRKLDNEWDWYAIDNISAIVMLIDNIYATDNRYTETPHQKLELLTRTLDSHQIMQDYLTQRLDDNMLNESTFIASEQSLLFGHWLHPTPKSRQGVHAWQHQHYTPELQSHFQLHFFAVSRELIKQHSVVEACTEQIINQMAEVDDNFIEADKQLIPVHPLQAQWLLHQGNIKALQATNQIVSLGEMGKTFTPTSSVRTLYCSELDYMIKLSIPVKITNSLRQNMAHELAPGLHVGSLIANSSFPEQYPQFSLIEDPAYITVQLPDMKESGFEAIIRKNPFITGSLAQKSTLSIAALVQEPILENTQAKLTQCVIALAAKQQISTESAALLWFERYWQCAIAPAIYLYENHGIALEAHQQNSLLTITDHYPSHYYYRDNQGFYLSQTMRDNLLKQEPNLGNTEDLFYEDDMIADRFGYYLVVNQLFSIISRLGQDNLIEEAKLLQWSYQKLSAMGAELTGVGAHFIRKLLNSPAIPCKANLLTRVEDLDELQAEQELVVYSQIHNPFFDLQQQSTVVNQQLNEVKLASA